MNDLLQQIQNWFLDKGEYIKVFADVDARIEGWFKGELIVLLKRLFNENLIENFYREYKIDTPESRKQIDFKISLNGESNLCEIKSLCISQTATHRNLNFYFRDDDVGLIYDFRKLESLPYEPYENKWVIGFIYPKPEYDDWATEINSLPDDLNHWECITDPHNFPDYLFISIWTPKKYDT